ncbi:MAG: serine/threonine-protein kinase [Luteimonas sp.]|nr:serine/threonine-protein kinase [Luteimonas sp.]
MNTDLWLRAKTILGEVADLAPDERAARIAAASDGDADLRAEVERLLALDDEAGLYFGALQGALNPEDAAPGQIGVYRIVGEIGRGGMGAVYLGERCDGQFEQRVAIKVVHDGIGGRLIARFREERRILAQLEHPGIAYLVDGGSLPDGRPYFVMEHVEGESITAYADRKRLDVEARLALFREVCAAVAYAHRNLVIHRDLKPGNVMVEEDDQGQPSIKLLDFGIARIIEEGIAGKAIDDDGQPGKREPGAAGARAALPAQALTEHGDRLLTPLYAAPEQILGHPATTAVDIYALGVLLHELLTGARPFAAAASTRQEMERAILETDPPPPSQAAAMADPGTAAHRKSTPRQLARRLHGDLDSIVLKALRKQPERRYAFAAQLSEDINRHLTGRAVTARRGTWRYRTHLFVRRYRWGVAATTVVVLAALSMAALHVSRITHERDLARAATAKAEAVSELLIGMFNSADPAQARGQEVTVREVMDRAATELEGKLSEQPALLAEMDHIIGGVYMHLGEYEPANNLLRRALELRRQLHGPRHLDVSESLHSLAVLAWAQGRHGDAETMLRDVLARRLQAMGPDDLEVARVRNDLAAVLRRTGKLGECEALYRQAIATRRAQLGDDHPDLLSSLNNLAVLLNDLGRVEEAEALYREVIASRRRAFGPIHPKVANTMGSLAESLRARGRFDESEALSREVLAMRLALYDDTHPLVALSMNALGGALRGQKRYDEAEVSYRKALAIRRKAFGNEHQLTASSLNNLGNLYRDKGEPARAEPLYREAIAIYRTKMGDDHPWTATGIKNLGEMFLQMGDNASAQAQFSEALRIRELVYGDAHPLVAETRTLLESARAAQQVSDAR